MGPGAARPKRNHQGTIFMTSQAISHSKSTGPATAGQAVSDPASENVGVSSLTLVRAIPSPPREAMIATAAYYRAEQRGFAPGNELADWLAAEREVDRL
jgi:hypothetical protein